MKEFLHFIREKGVLGLAVGIIMGGAVTDFVKSIVDNLINPIIGWIIKLIAGSATNLAAMKYTVPMTEITFGYGAFIVAMLNFIAVLAVVYFVFVKSPLNKIDKKD